MSQRMNQTETLRSQLVAAIATAGKQIRSDLSFSKAPVATRMSLATPKIVTSRTRRFIWAAIGLIETAVCVWKNAMPK
jgi:hypothetical protein